jgi:PKD repeat protein
VFVDFGADGALYVGSYSGGYYTMSNTNMGVWRFAYTGGPDTPGPDPKAVVPTVGSVVQFNIGKSGGVSYTWDFGDGSPKVTTQDAVVSHTYDSAGSKTASLTVNYADGDTATKTVTAADVPTPLFTNVQEEVGATVPMVLSLTLGGPATFGSFIPSLNRDYDAKTTAKALATSGNATLTVSDPAAGSAGHLVNGDYTLPSALQVKATSTVGTSAGVFSEVGGTANPTTLLTYLRALNDSTITLDFKQHVAQTDALRAGKYSKTLTFSLATTQP